VPDFPLSPAEAGTPNSPAGMPALPGS